MAKSDSLLLCLLQHETGLCKNLLQEYAQKMNYAIPLYVCQRDELSGRRTLFTCTVEIGGIRYIGGAAGTKKEAEIKAARTALIAIQSGASESSKRLQGGESQLTVLPCKKRGPEMTSASISKDAENSSKPKKARVKKKASKRKLPRNNFGHCQVANAEHSDSRIAEAEASAFPMRPWCMEPMGCEQPGGGSGIISNGMENSVGSFCWEEDVNTQNGIPQTLIVGHSQHGNAENTDPKFIEANGSSLLIEQQMKDPMRYPRVGGSNVISNDMDRSGERFYQHIVNSCQSLQSSRNIVVGNHDAPATGMPSIESRDITAFHMEKEEEPRASEAGPMSGSHSNAGVLETSSGIILPGFNQTGERIQAGAN